MTKMIKHLYVHVPFCKSICYYCDFCHNIYNVDIVDKWLLALKKEIDNECKDNYETIYIGGGTPNSLQYDELDKLLSLIEPYSHNCLEYTIELNPECFDIKQIELFKKYHINRFSIGLQTSDDNLLKSLNRKHSFDDIKNIINILKENGFNNISLDLMYSLPNQTMSVLNKTLNDVIKLDVPHISIYSLTIEENSVFGKNGINHLDEETEADMYEYIVKFLEEHDYIHYEVSNFSKDGYKSKHNLSYWNYEDYLGVSLSASSKIGNKRFTNTRSFNKYFDSYKTKDEDLILSKKDLIIENVMMSLRTNEGLSLDEFYDKYELDFKMLFKNSLEKFNNDIKCENGRVIVNNMAILNHILSYMYIDLDNYDF